MSVYLSDDNCGSHNAGGVSFSGLGDEAVWYCPSLSDSFNDLSGNGNHGTAIGGIGTVVDTDSGGSLAYLFDGSDDRISITNFDTGTSTGGTLAMWVNPVTLENNDGIYGFDYSTDKEELWCYLMANGQIRPRYRNAAGTTRGWLSSTGIAVTGAWLHYAFVRSGEDSATFYINGVDQAIPTNNQAGLAPRNGSLDFGVGYSSLPCNALMDDMRIYTRALTGTELAHLATSRGIEGAP